MMKVAATMFAELSQKGFRELWFETTNLKKTTSNLPTKFLTDITGSPNQKYARVSLPLTSGHEP